jgi:hypothetical protein
MGGDLIAEVNNMSNITTVDRNSSFISDESVREELYVPSINEIIDACVANGHSIDASELFDGFKKVRDFGGVNLLTGDNLHYAVKDSYVMVDGLFRIAINHEGAWTLLAEFPYMESEWNLSDLTKALEVNHEAILDAHGIKNNKGADVSVKTVVENKVVVSGLSAEMQAKLDAMKALNKPAAVPVANPTLNATGNATVGATLNRPVVAVAPTVVDDETIRKAFNEGIFDVARTVAQAGIRWYNKRDTNAWVPDPNSEDPKKGLLADLSMVTSDGVNEALDLFPYNEKGVMVPALRFYPASDWMVRQYAQNPNYDVKFMVVLRAPMIEEEIPISVSFDEHGLRVSALRIYRVYTTKKDGVDVSVRTYRIGNRFTAAHHAQILSFAHERAQRFFDKYGR